MIVKTQLSGTGTKGLIMDTTMAMRTAMRTAMAVTSRSMCRQVDVASFTFASCSFELNLDLFANLSRVYWQ
jgi:hypothetical protein